MTHTQTPTRTVVAVIMLLALLAGPASARQQAPSTAPEDLAQLEQETPTAPVMVDGVALFRVRGVSSFPADQRARTIADRIRDIAANPAIRPDALRVEEMEYSSQLVADKQLVMNVYDADAKVEGVPRRLIADLYLVKVRSAIVAYRTDRSAPAMQRAGMEALVTTLVFAVLVIAIIWLRRRLDALLDRRFGERIKSLASMSQDVLSAKRVWAFLDAALRFTRSAAIAVLALMYLRRVFGLFPHTRSAANSVTGYVIGPLQTMWASFVSRVPDLVFLVVLVLVVRVILGAIRRFFEAVEHGRIHLANFDREWATPTYKLLRPMIVAFAIVVGYPYIPGSDSEAFKGVSLFLGIVFSLGSSSFIANMIAGYSMTYRRAFKLGDFVQIGDVRGRGVGRSAAGHPRADDQERGDRGPELPDPGRVGHQLHVAGAVERSDPAHNGRHRI